MPGIGESCLTCFFAVVGGPGGGDAQRRCNINGPTQKISNGDLFPVVLDTDWCGEFSTDGTRAASSGAYLQTNYYYSASGTIQIPVGARKAQIRMWGGTGGSRGLGASGAEASDGTGAGGYLEKFLSGLVPGNTFIFTLGGAGAAGVSGGGAPGGAGGDTVLASGTQSIPTLTAGGSNGRPGGVATGGDLNITGQAGTIAVVACTDPTTPLYKGISGVGGSTMESQGAHGVASISVAIAGNAGKSGGAVIDWYA